MRNHAALVAGATILLASLIPAQICKRHTGLWPYEHACLGETVLFSADDRKALLEGHTVRRATASEMLNDHGALVVVPRWRSDIR